jgi:tetratricopeptide (TPR) repeat protein/predicted Ser/Thr protein kinase
MGEVFCALDPRLRREVAIKVLAPQESENEDRRRAFQHEARAASALNHPNIVTIHEIGHDKGFDFIVMERVEGRTLSEILSREGLPVDDAVRHFTALALALGRAHRAGIVHRDLKPGNIMLTTDGQVKILDFGVAKLNVAVGAATASDLTTTMTQVASLPGHLSGTVAYMSPEQATGQPVEARSDIFSLGIVLYEALAGKRPWEGATGMAVLQGVCLLEPPRLRDLRPDLPPALDAIVSKALRKAPAERYQTMEEFAAALQSFASGAHAPPVWRRWALVASAAAVVVIGGGVVYWKLPSKQSATAPAAQQGPPALQVADPFQAYQQARTLLVRYDRPQNVDQAIALLRAAATKEPGHAPSQAALSDACVLKFGLTRDREWLKQAEQATAAALRLNPYLAAAHISKAALDAASGRAEDATRGLRKALELDPKNAEAHWRLATRLNVAGEGEEAMAMAQKAAELAPDDWRASMTLGSLEHARGQYPAALKRFEHSLELAPDNPLVFQNMAGTYHMLNRWEDAAGALQRALEIRPTPNAYSNLGTILYFQSRFDEAVAAFEKAAQLRPDEYLYQGNLADAYRWSAGRKPQAAASYQKAISLAREALKTRPNDSNPRASVAVYLAKLGKPAEGVRELSALPPNESRPGVLYKIAIVRELAGDRAGALAALKAGLNKGLAFYEVEHEPEFNQLHDDPGYRQLAALAARRAP